MTAILGGLPLVGREKWTVWLLDLVVNEVAVDEVSLW